MLPLQVPSTCFVEAGQVQTCAPQQQIVLLAATGLQQQGMLPLEANRPFLLSAISRSQGNGGRSSCPLHASTKSNAQPSAADLQQQWARSSTPSSQLRLEAHRRVPHTEDGQTKEALLQARRTVPPRTFP